MKLAQQNESSMHCVVEILLCCALLAIVVFLCFSVDKKLLENGLKMLVWMESIFLNETYSNVSVLLYYLYIYI